MKKYHPIEFGILFLPTHKGADSPESESQLAKRSNVSLRSIQMYEQRNKDINKASAETVLSLAKVLGCTMEDLLET